MLNLEEIENTIAEMEQNSATTFDTCEKLASLYIVRDNLKTCGKSVVASMESEINDILPAYRNYCDIKRQYQMHELPVESVEIAMQSVCKEIQDLFLLLYANSDTQSEREQIQALLNGLYTRIIQ